MIKDLVKQVEKQPLSLLLVAAAGVAATVAIARSQSGQPPYTRVAREGVRQLGEAGSSLAKDARSGARRGIDEARQLGERGSEVVHDARESAERGIERARNHANSWSGRSHRQPAQRLATSMGVQEKTLAVFLATLLAKSVSGFIRWRAEEKARHQAEALASDSGEDFDTQLEEQTVAELRKQASELDIHGRSTMNKEELVDALKG